MTLVEQFHTAHKERLSRLGAIPPKAGTPEQFRQELHDLQTKVEHQQAIIADLNSTVAKQRKIIRDFVGEKDIPTPRIADVIAVVAEYYRVTRVVLIGPGRDAKVAAIRQVGYYLCREYGYAFLAIGRGFFRDHSSAVHGASKIERRLINDRCLALEIEDIKSAIEKYVARRIETVKGMMA